MNMSEKDLDMLAEKLATRLNKSKKSKADDGDDESSKESKVEKKDQTSLGLLVGFGKNKKK